MSMLFIVNRIGLVFVVNTADEIDGRRDVGVAVYRAFNYIRTHESAVKALSFLTDVRMTSSSSSSSLLSELKCSQTEGHKNAVCSISQRQQLISTKRKFTQKRLQLKSQN